MIVYLLVTGYPPFNGSSTPEIFGRIKTGRYRFPSKSKVCVCCVFCLLVFKAQHETQQTKHKTGTLVIRVSERSHSQVVGYGSAQTLICGGCTQGTQQQTHPKQRNETNPNKPTKNKQNNQQQNTKQHPWVAGDAAPETPLPESVITALTDFQYQCRLKKAVGKVLVGRMTDDDRIRFAFWFLFLAFVIVCCSCCCLYCFLLLFCCRIPTTMNRLGEVFKKFDLNGDGQLGPDEIGAFMKHVGRKEVDAKALIERFDENQDGSISVVCALVRRSILTVCVQDEFAVATQTGQLGAASEEQIKKNFDTFDYDHDGFVSPMEIERLCVGLSADQVFVSLLLCCV